MATVAAVGLALRGWVAMEPIRFRASAVEWTHDGALSIALIDGHGKPAVVAIADVAAVRNLAWQIAIALAERGGPA